MNLEGFVTDCFRRRLAEELLAVSATPIAGAMHVRVTVCGRLPEAEAVAADLMAEFAELDRSVRIGVELGKLSAVS